MKTVIEMAREAGWKDLRDYDSEMRHDFFMGNTDSLARFAELVRADEREACAKVADGYIGADPIADAIRARSKA
jgi:hypothetical protein